MRIPNDDTIFEMVADYVCVAEFQSYEMVMSMARYPELVKTPRLVNVVMNQMFGWSQTRIAKQWLQDHTSVGHGLRNMTDSELQAAESLGYEIMDMLKNNEEVSQ